MRDADINYDKRSGFTLFEIIIVSAVAFFLIAVMLPITTRLIFDSKMSLVRQNAFDAGNYLMACAHSYVQSQPDNSYTIADFIMGNPYSVGEKPSLVEHYTGNSVYDEVEKIVPANVPITNPFNKVSIFDSLNDDTNIPARQPGLLFLGFAADKCKESTKTCFYNLYFTMTGKNSEWYDSVDPGNQDEIRRGVFVTRLSYRPPWWLDK